MPPILRERFSMWHGVDTILSYTMTPQAAAEAARAFKPKIFYPYHQSKSDPQEVKKLRADVPEIEVRVLALP